MDNKLIEAVGKALDLLKNPEDVVYIDTLSQQHVDLKTAAAKRTPVVVLSNRDSAYEILKGVGIDLDNKRVAAMFIELGEALGGKVRPRRINTDPKEKDAIVKESFNLMQGESLKDFAERKGIGYQALLKWRKQLKP
jgi:hypothetical protein